MRLADKVALVTGAASGFGAEIARAFARAGAKVSIIDLNVQGAQAVAASIGPEAMAFGGDVSVAQDVAAAFAPWRNDGAVRGAGAHMAVSVTRLPARASCCSCKRAARSLSRNCVALNA